MTPRLDLRDLDRRLVPAAAQRLRALLIAYARLRQRTDAQVRRGLATASAAADRLDERATATGPLTVLRDVPQLALLAVAAVFLAGTAAALVLDERPPAPTAAPTTAGLDAIVRVGIPPGSDVELYLAQTRVVLDDLAERLPDAQLFAVVHLTRYVGADELFKVVEGVDLQRVYLRASTAGPEAEVIALPVQTQTAATVLPALCEATAARKAEDALNFTTLAESISPSTPEEQLGRADFEAEAARAALEAEAYSGPCVTAFATVVQAPAALLRSLLDRDGVRGVEPGPAGVALADLDVQPLFPETTGVVPSGNER